MIALSIKHGTRIYLITWEESRIYMCYAVWNACREAVVLGAICVFSWTTRYFAVKVAIELYPNMRIFMPLRLCWPMMGLLLKSETTFNFWMNRNVIYRFGCRNFTQQINCHQMEAWSLICLYRPKYGHPVATDVLWTRSMLLTG